MDYVSVTNIVLSSVMAIAAVIALFVSIAQISIANKQALFDRRLKAFLTVKWMVALSREDEDALKMAVASSENAPFEELGLLFDWMCNCSFLESLQGTLNYVFDPKIQRAFLLKMEELQRASQETRLIFGRKIGNKLADFISSYEETLMFMYKYHNSTKRMAERNSGVIPESNKSENDMRRRLAHDIAHVIKLSKEIDLKKVEAAVRF